MNREEALNFPTASGRVRTLLMNLHEFDTLDDLRAALSKDWIGTRKILLRPTGSGSKTVDCLMRDLGMRKPPPDRRTAVFLSKRELTFIIASITTRGERIPLDLYEKLCQAKEELNGHS